MTDEQLDSLLRQAGAWLRMARETLEKGSQHQLAHRGQLEATLKGLQEWQQAENRTADADKGGE